MIERLLGKIKASKLYFIIYSIFKRNKSNLYKDLLRDWGKDDVYGPWTKYKDKKVDGQIRFYKSYYLIDGNEKPKDDLLKGQNNVYDRNNY